MNRGASGLFRSKTGMHHDDGTIVETGTKQGLQGGNTMTVRKHSIFVGTVPQFITVYRPVFTGANPGRTGSVKWGFREL